MENSPSRKEFLVATTAAGVAMTAAFGFNRLAHGEEDEETISQLATIGVNPEKKDEAMELLKGLVKAVEENEPGVLAYICHAVDGQDDKVIFFEMYKDQAALDAHGKTPHLGKMRAAFGSGVLKMPVEITRLHRIAGFYRG